MDQMESQILSWRKIYSILKLKNLNWLRRIVVDVDHKLKKTTDILQKPLLQATGQVFTEIYERQDRELDNTLRNTFNENSDLLNCINKHKLGAQLSRRLENEMDLPIENFE